MNKKVIVAAFILIVFGFLYYFYHQSRWLQKHPVEQKQFAECTSSCYVFLEDFEVTQAVYSGGDFPSGTETTKYKKGQIVQGRQGLDGCQGDGCIPKKVIIINVNGQNWPVDETVLVPHE